MKYLGILIISFIQLTCIGQSTSSRLIGTWKIEKVVNNSSSSVNCEGVTGFKLTFNSDSTYTFDAGSGYITAGKWKIEGNKINFYNNKLLDPSKGSVGDHAYTYKIRSDGILVIDEYMCSELGGKTFYKKI
jgi:hypothetical protein